MSAVAKLTEAWIEDSPLYGRETLRAAPQVRALGDVVQNIVMTVQDWVDEANGTFASNSTLLIDLGLSVDEHCEFLAFSSRLTKVKTEANRGDARLEP